MTFRIFFHRKSAYLQLITLQQSYQYFFAPGIFFITENRFYCIENRVAEGVRKPEFYAAKHLFARKMLFLIYLSLELSVIIIVVIYYLDNFAHYHNQEYLTELLLSGKSRYSSVALMRAEIADSILFWAVLTLTLVPVVLHRGRKIGYISTADSCSECFAKCNRPFLDAGFLTVAAWKPARKLKSVRDALRRWYLLNCTLEKHEDKLKIALAIKGL